MRLIRPKSSNSRTTWVRVLSVTSWLTLCTSAGDPFSSLIIIIIIITTLLHIFFFSNHHSPSFLGYRLHLQLSFFSLCISFVGGSEYVSTLWGVALSSPLVDLLCFFLQLLYPSTFIITLGFLYATYYGPIIPNRPINSSLFMDGVLERLSAIGSKINEYIYSPAVIGALNIHTYYYLLLLFII